MARFAEYMVRYAGNSAATIPAPVKSDPQAAEPRRRCDQPSREVIWSSGRVVKKAVNGSAPPGLLQSAGAAPVAAQRVKGACGHPRVKVGLHHADMVAGAVGQQDVLQAGSVGPGVRVDALCNFTVAVPKQFALQLLTRAGLEAVADHEQGAAWCIDGRDFDVVDALLGVAHPSCAAGREAVVASATLAAGKQPIVGHQSVHAGAHQARGQAKRAGKLDQAAQPYRLAPHGDGIAKQRHHKRAALEVQRTTQRVHHRGRQLVRRGLTHGNQT